MASTGDDGSETDSVPDEVFQRSSSAVAAGAEDDVQYAQDPRDDEDEVPEEYRQSLVEEGHSPEIERNAQHASESEYSDQDEDRENRFQGPASTWLFYTESERGLAASLDQARANDLASHLYNAHALKARVREPDASSKVQHHLGKKQWVKRNEDGTLPWHPDVNWTAWPMKPDDVPRNGERFGVPITSREDEKATYRMPVSWKPNADLEGEIQALMQKSVKEQIEKHRRHFMDTQKSLPLRIAKESSPRKRKRTLSSISNEGSSEDTGDVKPSLPLPNRNDSISEDSDENDDYEWPEMLLDDDEAAEIFQPNVRHVISKLDKLLLSLHKSTNSRGRESPISRSRSRRHRKKSRSREKSQSDPAQEGDSNDSAQDSSSSSGERPSRSRRASRTALPVPVSKPIQRNTTKSEEEQKPKRKRPLNPRDWSEVLGVASLLGWNADVVQRATARCSDLFDESMTFGQPDQPEKGEGNDEARTEQLVKEEDEEQGYGCPFETCARYAEPWPLKKTWRWREHLKRVHKYSKGEIEELESKLKSERPGDAEPGADDRGDGKGDDENA